MGPKINVPITYLLITLMIIDASLFDVSPKKTLVYHGDDTQLNCTFQETLEDKAWIHGTTRVTKGKTVEEYTEHYGVIIARNAYNLQVHNATSYVSGLYTCLSLSNKTVASSANLYVIDQTPECSVSQNATVIEGQEIAFKCTINLPEEASGNLVWLKRGHETYRGTGNTTTWITELWRSDNGAEFDCQLQHNSLPRSRWSTLSCDIKIVMNVQYGPNVSVVAVGGNTIVEGQSMTVECLLNDANPEGIVEVKWKSPNGSLISQNKTLFLKCLSRHDSGKYTCLMSNVFHNGKNGTGKASVKIYVQYPPRVRITLISSTNITEGENVTFHCKARNGNPKSDRIMLVLNEKHVVHSVAGPSLKHTIYGINQKQSGFYECVAFTTFYNGHAWSSSPIRMVFVYHSPNIVCANNTYLANLNDNVNMTCDVYGFPIPGICWSIPSNLDRDNFKLVERRTSWNKITTTLSVKLVHFSYYWKYTFRANNGILPISIGYVMLGEPESLRLVCANKTYRAHLNDDVNMTCVVYGFPIPNITWSFPSNLDGDQLKHVKRRTDWNKVTTTLLVKVVNFSFYERYTCTANNGISQIITEDVMIGEAESLRLVCGNKTYRADLNDDVNMTCVVYGFPIPKITWSRPSNLDGDQFKYVERRTDWNKVTSTLSVKVVNFSFYARYTCTANNGISQIRTEDVMIGEAESPRLVCNISTYRADLGDDVNMTCDVYGFPIPIITWFFPSRLDRDNLKFVDRRIDWNKVITTFSVNVVDYIYYSNYTCTADNGIFPSSTETTEIKRPVWKIVLPVILPVALAIIIGGGFVLLMFKLNIDIDRISDD